MSRLAKYNALSAEIKRCEREQAFLGFGSGVLDPRFVDTRNSIEGDDEDYDFFDDDDDDEDDGEYPQPPGLTKEEEMKKLRDSGIVVYDEDDKDGGGWDNEYLENHEQPRNITDEQLEEMLREFNPSSYIPAAGKRSVPWTGDELEYIKGGSLDEDVEDPKWPI